MLNTFDLLKKLAFMALPVTLLATACSSPLQNDVSMEGAFLRSIDELEPIERSTDEKLNVVATTNIVYDVVQNVGGELIQLEALIPRGSDPHAYEPSPGDLQTLVQADLIFINGVDLEEPLHPTFSEIANDTAIVSLSEGLTLQAFSEDKHEAEVADEAEDHDHDGSDPHVWLDPLNIEIWTENASRSLSAVDPAHADQYQVNADLYRQQLQDLHSWTLEQVSEIPVEQRKLVTDHRALGYFAARYSFELIDTVIPAYSTAAEPSARELGELVDVIEAESVRAIFVGTNVNTNLADRVAQDTGIQVVPLYIGTLSSPEGPAGSYLAMMKYNVEAIVAALGTNN
ncbi:MAG: metal ABC transporter substrate-binding protein [Anaerolineales bacterium]|jgi:ABC-type Zn uptake system ZnuABC Zn-binding protein ZnuA